ncbi:MULTISPECIES: tripartite tricarboxylate transporter permease [Alteribacter]|uniref:C4-dicarboxylate ABC transporter permease n=1 Tax=Alteribacter keqinensis TaxID=2483800 RepID=A0A3M7TQA6_9BACI|nr:MULTISPECIES: tripartite tricarboxylate transporter permease [Alteribacter]MBM7095763.1 tripartite tricarboxylate transporter permease [Alteribacter salitolerans]RNA67635.1 C4-dicarboxylate ABC transporter permease [Alteribacter keqinensis]
MDFEVMLQGFVNALSWQNIIVIVLATTLGVVIGSMPGLSAAMGVALLIPMTFTMDPATGLIMLIGIYCGAIFGGSISAILISTPGTPAASATLIEGYEMTKKGQGGKALKTAAVASFTGAMVSAVALYGFAPLLAQLSLRFGPAEYFWLAVFGLTIIAGVSTGSMLKGLLAGAFGLVLAMIGLDPITGMPRFTFGMNELISGIPFTPALIGLFAMSQVLIMAEKRMKNTGITNQVKDNSTITWGEIKKMKTTLGRSSIIGTIIGLLPGAGATIAAFVGYNEAKRFSKNKDEFGKGAQEGVAGAEAANNSVTGSSLIPTLTLGIPGESVTAVLLGGLVIHGLQPGPDLFTVHANTTYTFLAGFVFVNVVMLLLGLYGARYFVGVTKIPDGALIPIIFTLSVIGSYAIHNNFFDVILMFIFGLIGYFFRKFTLNSASIVLALILGILAESGFRRTLVISGNDPLALVASPISIVLIVLTVLSLFSPIVMNKFTKSAT